MTMTEEQPAAAVPKVEAQIAQIDPQRAHELLMTNDHNRSLSHQVVKAYAADMAAGKWTMNGEAIKLSATGRVLDGQHRLEAVIEADATIQTLLITGLPDQAQETMDQGRARTFGDVLKLRGEKYFFVLAGATRSVWSYERDRVPHPTAGVKPTVAQLSRTLERSPELRDSIEATVSLRQPWFPHQQLAVMHYLFEIAAPGQAVPFLERVVTGERLEVTDPRYVLRERLIRDYLGGQEIRLTQAARNAYVVIAWNAWIDGEQLPKLRWNPGGANPDRFPTIRGMA